MADTRDVATNNYNNNSVYSAALQGASIKLTGHDNWMQWRQQMDNVFLLSDIDINDRSVFKQVASTPNDALLSAPRTPMRPAAASLSDFSYPETYDMRTPDNTYNMRVAQPSMKQRKHNAALSLLILSRIDDKKGDGPTLLLLLASVEPGIEQWRTLVHKYEKQGGLAAAIAKAKDIALTTMGKGESVQLYITRLHNMHIEQCRLAGTPLDESAVLMKLVTTLDPSYDSLLSTLDMDASTFTWESVTRRLLAEETRRHLSGSHRPTSTPPPVRPVAMYTGGGACHRCGENGHHARTCTAPAPIAGGGGGGGGGSPRCQICHKAHKTEKCRAHIKCSHCSKTGHDESVCFSKHGRPSSQRGGGGGERR
jgi:hypothetical protein